jgi:hypothetical protein
MFFFLILNCEESTTRTNDFDVAQRKGWSSTVLMRTVPVTVDGKEGEEGEEGDE